MVCGGHMNGSRTKQSPIASIFGTGTTDSKRDFSLVLCAIASSKLTATIGVQRHAHQSKLTHHSRKASRPRMMRRGIIFTSRSVRPRASSSLTRKPNQTIRRRPMVGERNAGKCGLLHHFMIPSLVLTELQLKCLIIRIR